jgi:hypothetical protein
MVPRQSRHDIDDELKQLTRVSVYGPVSDVPSKHPVLETIDGKPLEEIAIVVSGTARINQEQINEYDADGKQTPSPSSPHVARGGHRAEV